MAAARLAEVRRHCEAARRGEERGGNSRFWWQCWERMAVAVLPGSGKALSVVSARDCQGKRVEAAEVWALHMVPVRLAWNCAEAHCHMQGCLFNICGLRC